MLLSVEILKTEELSDVQVGALGQAMMNLVKGRSSLGEEALEVGLVDVAVKRLCKLGNAAELLVSACHVRQSRCLHTDF